MVSNGLRVKKSTDPNSCPSGWKIWSPRNKNDWIIVYNALGRNKGNYPFKPYLLIDITRNQNGCGGCTSHAMKSGVTQQSSWGTSDGSAWWLRDTTYMSVVICLEWLEHLYFGNCFSLGSLCALDSFFQSYLNDPKLQISPKHNSTQKNLAFIACLNSLL